MKALPNISEHLTYREATYSASAAAAGLDNTPDTLQLDNLKAWALYVFEPLRRLAGGFPIYFHRIFSAPAVNAIIPGADPHSQHQCLEGNAAGDMDNDNHPAYPQNDVLYMIAYNHLQVNYDKMIAEDITEEGHIGWIHISYNRLRVQRRISTVSFFVTYKDGTKKRVYRTFDLSKGFVRSKYLQNGEN